MAVLAMSLHGCLAASSLGNFAEGNKILKGIRCTSDQSLPAKLTGRTAATVKEGSQSGRIFQQPGTSSCRASRTRFHVAAQQGHASRAKGDVRGSAEDSQKRLTALLDACNDFRSQVNERSLTINEARLLEANCSSILDAAKNTIHCFKVEEDFKNAIERFLEKGSPSGSFAKAESYRRFAESLSIADVACTGHRDHCNYADYWANVHFARPNDSQFQLELKMSTYMKPARDCWDPLPDLTLAVLEVSTGDHTLAFRCEERGSVLAKPSPKDLLQFKKEMVGWGLANSVEDISTDDVVVFLELLLEALPTEDLQTGLDVGSEHTVHADGCEAEIPDHVRTWWKQCFTREAGALEYQDCQ